MSRVVSPSSTRFDSRTEHGKASQRRTDVYFSADVETDGPIPGPYSLLSFALVYAGTFDGGRFTRPTSFDSAIYSELRPIAETFEPEALRVNGLDRERLLREGQLPEVAMTEACAWVKRTAGAGHPVLVAYPLAFDWSWLYWYFVRYSRDGSPFSHSSCFDIKTAFAVKGRLPMAQAGRSNLYDALRPQQPHQHHALSDAVEQAQIFGNVFEWEGRDERFPRIPPR